MPKPSDTVDLTRGVYRKVYQGFVTGRRINKVSVEAEALFWRLNVIADDFGTFPADALLCKNLAAPLRDWSPAQVDTMLVELEAQRLITLFAHGNDFYGSICQFIVNQPAGRSGRRIKRWPDPGDEGSKPSKPPKHGKNKVRGNPGESGGVSSSDTDTDTEDHAETESCDAVASPAPRVRAPDPVWDYVASRWYPSGIAPSLKSSVGRIVADFRALNASPAEIKRRADQAERAWPGHTVTARSVVKHWDSLSPRPDPDEVRDPTPEEADALLRGVP
ncbi:MAG: hypothetical protein IT437_07280 [Phycisphaerales bacterium]|nr:hypothetical protein [Phycisphaerales bacterium]